MDEIAGNVNEEVLIQIGSTSYKPINAKYFDFKVFEQIREFIKKARITVCHGGAGTLITALDQGKPVIAVPRLKKYNEAFDDHQLELIDALAKDGKIMAVYDLEELEDIINSSFKVTSKKIKKDERLVRALKEYIIGLTN